MVSDNDALIPTLIVVIYTSIADCGIIVGIHGKIKPKRCYCLIGLWVVRCIR